MKIASYAFAALVLLAVGLTVLVKTGAVDSALSECSVENEQRAKKVASTIEAELPGRFGAVTVEGYCWQDPRPSVEGQTSASRTAVSGALKDQWGCRAQTGAVPATWECSDVGGFAIELVVEDDGGVSAVVTNVATTGRP